MLALSGLLLGACTAQQERRVGTYDKIGAELNTAAANKSNRQAQSDAVGRAMVPPLQLEQPAQPKAESRFNLAVNNAPITQVLTALVTGTQYSMLFPPEVSGSVSLNLKNVTIREVLDTLREIYGYEYRIQGMRISVQPNTMQTRLFKINYLANRRQGMSDTRVTGSSPSTSGTNTNNTGTNPQMPTNTPGGNNPAQGQSQASDSSRVRTTSDYDFWKDLTAALNTIVGTQDGRNVIVTPVSGVVLVKAMPAELRAVNDYLKATQLVVERQVMLEAKIIEVALSDSYQAGINWTQFAGAADRFAMSVMSPGATLATTGAMLATAVGVNGISGVGGTPGLDGRISTTNAGRGFFGLSFQSKDFAALVSFLEGQGDVQVLSSPRIATTNNQKAVLKVGTDDYFVTGVSSSTTATATNTVASPNITLQPFFSGIALDVTPQVDDDGNIILHVHPSVSVVEEKTKTVNLGDLGVYTLPLASSSISETDSIVRVQDGGIVAIGGLMSQEQGNTRTGLPGMSTVPGIGLLFGQRTGLSRKRELVILMRSTIIANESSWKESLSESQERIQAMDPRGRVMGWQ